MLHFSAFTPFLVLKENLMENTKRIGVISIIIHDRKESAEKVNHIISEHGPIILARLGLPYEPKSINIIALIVNGTTDEIGSLTGKLGALKGVEVKSVLTKA